MAQSYKQTVALSHLLLYCIRPYCSIIAFTPYNSMFNNRLQPTATTTPSVSSYGALSSSSLLFHVNRKSHQQDGNDEAIDITSLSLNDTNSSSSSSSLSSSSSSSSSSKSKIILISTLSTFIIIITSLAQSQWIPSLTYTDTNDLIQDILVTIFAAISSTLLIQFISYLALNQKIITTKDSRKWIHTLSAPLFCLLWPFYSTNIVGSQLFVLSVIFTQTFKLLLAGLGKGGQDEISLAKAVSRQGSKEEALGGPFLYCLVLLSVVLFFWQADHKTSAIMTLSAMAAGDGMADLIGRRYGTVKWSWSQNKSIVGTIAFILSSTLCAWGLFVWFSFMGDLTGNYTAVIDTSSWILVVGKIFFISTLCAMVELSTVLDDNITVPLTAALLSYFLF